jgi:hypothetical protein
MSRRVLGPDFCGLKPRQRPPLWTTGLGRTAPAATKAKKNNP